MGIQDGFLQASIVGRRVGVLRWSPTTAKTVEGSLAFVISITVCAFILRVCGYTERFSVRVRCFVFDPSLISGQMISFLMNVMASAVLEALSDQNDNLTLPLYLWSMFVLGGT